jgi:hypothetical protein
VIRRIALLGVMVLLVASCGDDDVLESSTPTTATTAAPTTVAETTVATTAAPTTVAPTTVAPTTVAPTTVAPMTVATTVVAAPQFPIIFESPGSPAFPAVFGNAGDPNGSGCAPGGDVLPDGVWFGYAEGVAQGVITFDLACYFTDAAADTASLAGDCDTEFGQYCVRNNNPKTFAVPISGTADVFYIEAGTWKMNPVAPSAWPVSGSYLTCPGQQCGAWLYINGGDATGIVEMFEE